MTIMAQQRIGAFTPRFYQEQDAGTAADGVGGSALLGHQMGVGKTLIAVEAIAKKIEAEQIPACPRILLVAPLNTHGGWHKHITSQIPDQEIHIHPPGGGKTKKAQAWWETMFSGQPGWYIIGWEAFRGTPNAEQKAQRQQALALAQRDGLRKPRKGINMHWGPSGVWDAVIADEVHRAANRQSVTAQTLKTVDTPNRLALSGTPAGNRVEGYWSVLNWLWPDKYKYFWPWAEEHCDVQPDTYTGKRVLGEKKPGGIASDIPTYLRRTTREVIKDLPEIIERAVEVPLKQGMQKRAYDEMEERAFTWLESQPLGAELPVVQSLRLRQLALGVPDITETGRHDEDGFPEILVDFRKDAKSNKIDALLEILSDLDPDTTAMIYTHSAKFTVPVVHQINASDRVEGLAVAWTGKTSHPGRRRIMADFAKKGGPRFIVAGIASIGEGVDGLQHKCSTEIWLSQHDNNMLNMQAEARVHRPGQKQPVNRVRIVSPGTVDTKVYTRLSENAQMMREAYRKENPR